MRGKQKILCVGLVCVDIINLSKTFPEEDSDQRVVEQRWQRGGNASNNCTVLSHIGRRCDFMGVVARSNEMNFILEDFDKNSIGTKHVILLDGCSCPTAVVIMNQETGSRTILAYRNPNTREMNFSDFSSRLDLGKQEYKWIHFEVRPNVPEIKQMLEYVDRHNGAHKDHKITTSIEMEKPRKDIDCLYDTADFVFVSKDFARHKGYKTKEEAAENFIKLCRNGATVIVPWGEDGAIAKTTNGQTVSSGIFPPGKVVDTLAAGDTFNAATLHRLMEGSTIKEAITFGCQVAGAKVGMQGFEGVKEFVGNL